MALRVLQLLGGASLVKYGVDKWNEMKAESAVYEASVPWYYEDETTLQRQLVNYYADYVCVPLEYAETTRQIMEEVVSDFQRFVNRSCEFHLQLDDPIPTGSCDDGLDIINANSFDVLVPICLPKSQWQLIKDYMDPGYAKLRNRVSYEHILPQKRSVFQEMYLSSRMIRDLFGKLIRKYADDGHRTRYRLTTLMTSESLLLKVSDHGGSLTIDLIPCVEIDGVNLVAKSYPTGSFLEAISGNCRNDTDVLWRRSFHEMERDHLQSPRHEGFKKCLMLMKCIRANEKEFAQISSYVLKTAYLHWRKQVLCSKWEEKNMLKHFRQFSGYLSSTLAEGKLCPFFEPNPNANLLKRHSSATLSKIRRFNLQMMQPGRLSLVLNNRSSRYTSHEG
ncbi:hypothetical protein CAPTEDRAFT_213545 [Capitella teleta]|uniref:Uncharacterized protein n=1 Tax=Capitella teleta TaxID=283909 RepID=R7VJU0_CAPTE|nr:hypothetical protein CAPTEDRAFT_213545 [Capitella teleta]|eukprot:ELU16185.1 hypothetical protein CAPTEDRAFT_213545 [Capitella teleta]